MLDNFLIQCVTTPYLTLKLLLVMRCVVVDTGFDVDVVVTADEDLVDSLALVVSVLN